MSYITCEKVSVEDVKSFLDYEENNSRFEIVKRYASDLLYAQPGFDWYFYRDVTHICGIACFVEDRTCQNSFHISVLCTDRDLRGSGIGTFIMKDAILKALKHGKAKVTLHSLNNAKDFYEKLGFQKLDNEGNYYYDL